jgi:hypothetical protein
MAGPQDIQRFPKGLIDLLGMRATGDTPRQLAQTTAPNIDLKTEYLLDRTTLRGFSAGIAPAGNGLFTGGAASGPAAGFMWYVFAAGFYTPTAIAAAATAAYALGIQNSSATIHLPLTDCSTPVLTAGQQWIGGGYFDRPYLMQPGDLFAWRVIGLTGAPGVNPQASILFAEVGI